MNRRRATPHALLASRRRPLAPPPPPPATAATGSPPPSHRPPAFFRIPSRTPGRWRRAPTQAGGGCPRGRVGGAHAGGRAGGAPCRKSRPAAGAAVWAGAPGTAGPPERPRLPQQRGLGVASGGGGPQQRRCGSVRLSAHGLRQRPGGGGECVCGAAGGAPVRALVIMGRAARPHGRHHLFSTTPYHPCPSAHPPVVQHRPSLLQHPPAWHQPSVSPKSSTRLPPQVALAKGSAKWRASSSSPLPFSFHRSKALPWGGAPPFPPLRWVCWQLRRRRPCPCPWPRGRRRRR